MTNNRTGVVIAAIATGNASNPWTWLGTKVSLGWHTPPGRSQSIAASLIPTGVWCDSVRNQQSEKTGAVRVCRNEGGWRCCSVWTQLFCDDLILSLTPAG